MSDDSGRALIVANWKLHGDAATNKALLNSLTRQLADIVDVDIAVCPPYVYLPQVRDLLCGSNVAFGAQDVSDQEQGAYTGEVSAQMLRDVGCDYVIVGHSERRRLYGEDDELIERKFSAALAAGLKPILCVGETLEQREAGKAEELVASQLSFAVEAAARLPDDAFGGVAWGVAYEPVWAIGTGRTASVGQVVEMHALIRERLAAPSVAGSVRVVYGGSIKPDNASALLQADGVDGGLIGGASLDTKSFYQICSAASRRMNA